MTWTPCPLTARAIRVADAKVGVLPDRERMSEITDKSIHELLGLKRRAFKLREACFDLFVETDQQLLEMRKHTPNDAPEPFFSSIKSSNRHELFSVQG